MRLGNALAVYSSRLSDSSHLIESKYDRVDEGWGERNTLATHSDLLSGICLAGNAEGAAVAAWVAYAETGSQLWAAAFVPDAGWSAGVPLGPESGSMSAAQCAVDPAGNALLAWSAHDGTKSLLYASRFEVETGFGEPQRLDQSESDDAGQRIAEAS